VTTIPSWCAPPAELLGRDATLQQARALVEEGPVTLVGPAGAGTTVTAGALLQALYDAGECEHLACIPVDVTATRADLVLALGLALGGTLPGDETSVLEALARPHTVVLLDDADLSADEVSRLVELAPSTTWVLTGRQPVLGHAIPVPPLEDALIRKLAPPDRDVAACRGRPLLACLPEGIEPGQDWAEALVQKVPGLEFLADVPTTVPAAESDARGLGVLHIGERIQIRRSLREALGRGPEPTPSALLVLLDRHAEVLHQIACDHLVHTDPMNLRVLRAASRSVEDPGFRALAAAAAARIHLRAFQASDALDLVRRTLSSRLSAPGRGLLRWIEGDALLFQGSDDLAHEAHLSAAAELHGAAGVAVRTALARRCADAWGARGDRVRAQRWITLARSELARTPDQRCLADVLRINGNLAAQAGELLGASALYEEALVLLEGEEEALRERVFVRIGLAAVAISDRSFAEAAEHLDQAAEDAGDAPLARAAVAWRRAELALRRGRREQARTALADASEGFRRAGSLRGMLLCARMQGDLAAASGNRTTAVEAWSQALALCVRTRNIAGLRRILRRRLVVEREGLPGPHVAELQGHLDRAEVLLDLS